MTQRTRILFLSANPWTTSRILVDEEAREIFEKIHEGPYRDRFEIHNHPALRPIDLQKLLLKYRPHIVHFSGHGTKREKLILGGSHGRGKTVDQQGLADVFALYNKHVRLVLLNACFTKSQAQSISEVVNYSIGTGKGIGDKVGVAFESAQAELALTRIPRSRGIELFVREGVVEKDWFSPLERRQTESQRGTNLLLTTESRFECQITILKTTQQTVLA
jgi:hypothetical protein